MPLISPRYQQIESGQYMMCDSEPVVVKTVIKGYSVKFARAELSADGTLTIHDGFIWDGPTGAVNTADTMVPSMLHDALCYFIAVGLLSKDERLPADRLYRLLLRKWGVPKWRRLVHYRGVRIGSLDCI